MRAVRVAALATLLTMGALAGVASGQPDGQVVLRDRFANDRNHWGHTTTDGVRARIKNGRFQFDVTKFVDFSIEHWPDTLLPKASSLRDVSVAVDLRLSSKQAGAALTCRIVDPNSDNQSSYVFVASPSNGIVRIYKKNPDGSPGVPAIADAPFAFQPNTTYRVEARCTGGKRHEPVNLELRVDGKTVAQGTDVDGYGPGMVGLRVGRALDVTKAAFAPFHVTFDNFEVRRLNA